MPSSFGSKVKKAPESPPGPRYRRTFMNARTLRLHSNEVFFAKSIALKFGTCQSRLNFLRTDSIFAAQAANIHLARGRFARSYH